MTSAPHKYQATGFCDLTLFRSFDEATRLSTHWSGFA